MSRVDPIQVLDSQIAELRASGDTGNVENLLEVREAFAALIEAAARANGDHHAPHDCYATGPLTGDPYRDLVECPGCVLAATLARCGSQP